MAFQLLLLTLTCMPRDAWLAFARRDGKWLE